MMPIVMSLLILLAAVLTAALVLAEIFFIPGVGLLGVIGVGGFVVVEYFFLAGGLVGAAILYAVLSIVLFVVGFYLLSRNRFIQKVALKASVDEVAVKLPEEVMKGAKGVAVSRLALVGTIRIGSGEGCLVEAESEGGFIDEGEPIYISDIRNNKVFVQRNNESTK